VHYSTVSREYDLFNQVDSNVSSRREAIFSRAEIDRWTLSDTIAIMLDTPNVEPLPPYTPLAYTPSPQSRDAETASIASAAPSYNSEPPAYDQIAAHTSQQDATSTIPRSQPTAPRTHRNRQPQQSAGEGLPRLQYAPGFVPRPENPFSTSNYNAISWSTVHRNPARKQYENVARRRAEQVDAMDTLATTFLAFTSPEQSPGPTSMLDVSGVPSSPPNEDPDLVGPVAAERNRMQRQYREMLRRDAAEARELESAGWDFMLEQSIEARASHLRLSEFPPKRRGFQRRPDGIAVPRSNIVKRMGIWSMNR